MPFTHGHALIIGVGRYQHSPRHNVPITTADAQAVAHVVQDAQFCGYPPTQVMLLSEAGATHAGILAALDQLAQTSKDDTVLLFYSGHGDYDTGGNYTLTTHDTRWQQGRVVPGSAISQAELLTRLRAIPAERVLLLVNACHAGELSPILGNEASPTGSALPDQTTSALLSTGSGRIVITACRETQYAFIGNGTQTLFAQALVDGLRGGGEIYSRNGYISVFDLYTHLYYALDEAVPRDVPQQTRDHYGTKQEPELTILKGVGPFAVALCRGASTLGNFPPDQKLDPGTAVREVAASRSQRAYENIIGTATVQGDNYGQTVGVNTGIMTQSNQTIQNDAPNQGAQGSFHGPVTFNQPQTTFNQQGQHVQGNQSNASRDIIHASGDVSQVSGKISTGDVSGSGIVIGHRTQSSVRNVQTGGGDYAEGNIDKRTGSFVQGDQFAMSGNFSGAMLTIQSTLNDVSQSIGAASQGNAATKAQMQMLLEQLRIELQKVPVEQASAAEAVAETVKAAVEQATKPQPNKMLVQISAEGLKQAAQNLAAVLPTILPLAQQITDMLGTFI